MSEPATAPPSRWVDAQLIPDPNTALLMGAPAGHVLVGDWERADPWAVAVPAAALHAAQAAGQIRPVRPLDAEAVAVVIAPDCLQTWRAAAPPLPPQAPSVQWERAAARLEAAGLHPNTLEQRAVPPHAAEPTRFEYYADTQPVSKAVFAALLAQEEWAEVTTYADGRGHRYIRSIRPS